MRGFGSLWRGAALSCSLALGAAALGTACGSSADSDSNGGAGASSAGASAAGTSGASAGAAGSSASGGMPAASGAAGSGAGGSSPVTAACTAYANARCTHYRDCLGVSFGLAYASLADCVAVTSQYCPLEVGAPGTSRSVAQLTACAEATVPQTCAEWLSAAPAACVLPGTQVEGASCEYNSQCASTYCAQTGGAWCGKCQARSTLGQECAIGVSSCAFGLVCAAHVCATPKAEEQACASSAECRADLRCSAGLCGKPQAVGAVCDSNNPSCALDSVCLVTGSSATCVKPSFVSVGATCDSTTPKFCNGPSHCLDSSGMGSNDGTCTANAAPGASCAVLGCLAPARCLNDVCVLPQKAATCP